MTDIKQDINYSIHKIAEEVDCLIDDAFCDESLTKEDKIITLMLIKSQTIDYLLDHFLHKSQGANKAFLQSRIYEIYRTYLFEFQARLYKDKIKLEGKIFGEDKDD
jgi:hypothetical protein